MRVGLNMAALRGYGSAAVGRNVWRELVALADGHTLLGWVSDTWAHEAEALAPRPHQVFSAAPGITRKVWTENVTIRRGLKGQKVDKLFSLGDTSLPFAGVPHLLLVQLAYLAVPTERWGFAASRAFRLKMCLIDANFAAALPSIDKLTVQTEFMKRGLVERWGIAPDRISVVPSSVEPWIVETQRARAAEPYVCCIAAGAPQKNHALLAPMMAALLPRWPKIRCRLTVEPSQVPELVQVASRFGVLSAFDFAGDTSHREAVQLLRGAVAAVLPSRLESFGIPYYEAMAVGCPVVCADLPFAREACGEAGLYADPSDPEGFAQHIADLLRDASFAEQQSNKVRQRFRAVYQPWSKVAAAYWRELEVL